MITSDLHRIDMAFLHSRMLSCFRRALAVYAASYGTWAPHTRHPTLPAAGERLRALFPEIVTTTPEVIAILALIETFAPTDYPILIEGESGTGKELIARAIHGHSARAKGPFIAENCAAIPESLLEAEFFGVRRGAFTGASAARQGLLRLAHGGTLFLDELGEMPAALQKKLLRVLQEGEFRPVGSGKTEKTDARVISAANRPLDALAATGGFRQDLLFRLNTVMCRLPPLRERAHDIPLLAEHFRMQCALAAPQQAVFPASFAPETMDLLVKYAWPGNVRELRNEILRTCVLARSTVIMPSHLSAKITADTRRAISRAFLRGSASLLEYEKQTVGAVIQEVLGAMKGNKAACAKLLGIPKTSLYRRMERYGILCGETCADLDD